MKNRDLPFDLIAIDCDGTLLDSHKNISSGAEQAIRKARSMGVKIALVTGRNPPVLQRVIDKLNLAGPFIGSGGAFVADLATGEIVERHTLLMEDVAALVHLCRQLKVVLFMDHNAWMMTEYVTEALIKIKEEQGYEWEVVPDLLKAIPESPEKGLVMGENEKLRIICNDFVSRNRAVNITFTSDHSMDILPEGVTKGTALRALANYMKIPTKRIAVIGDYLNDLDMFKVAGKAVAMGNAHELVKAAADLIAPSNDEGGVAWAINALLNSNLEKAKK